MKKTVWVSLVALMISVCVASVSTAKGNHAMTMKGTISSLDQSGKTFGRSAPSHGESAAVR